MRFFSSVCSHKKTSAPFSRRREHDAANRQADTAVLCLKCGAKLPYSFSEGTIVRERRKNAGRTSR